MRCSNTCQCQRSCPQNTVLALLIRGTSRGLLERVVVNFGLLPRAYVWRATAATTATVVIESLSFDKKEVLLTQNTANY